MDKSPLSRLSPELRNNIYERALFERRPVSISKNFWTEPALLRTCKQIREEAELLFYSMNNFTCVTNVYDDHALCLAQWLGNGPKLKLALIKSLTLSIEVPGSGENWRFGDQKTLHQENYEALTKALHRSTFGRRRTEQVLRCSVNGKHDGLTCEQLSKLSKPDIRLHALATGFMLGFAFPKRYIEASSGEDLQPLWMELSTSRLEMLAQ